MGPMRILRTPEERFAGLPDFPYEPRYAEVADGDGGTLRMAYVEAGPADGTGALLLHGEPTWSFLYRHVMRVLADAGLRVVAPDLVGLRPLRQAGRAGRPHLRPPRRVDARARCSTPSTCSDVTLVGQDWGGLIGLRLVGRAPGPVRAGRRRQHRPAHRRLPHAGRSGGSSAAAVARRARVSTSAGSSQPGARDRPRRRRCAPPTTRPSPTSRTRPGPRAMPGLVPTRPDDPAARGQPRGLGGPPALRQAVPGRLQRRRPDHRRHGADPRAGVPGRAGSSTRDRGRRPLPPGGRRRTARPSDRRLRALLSGSRSLP